MASFKIQESKRKARRSINCMMFGWMMMYGIAFVDWVMKLEKRVSEGKT